MILLKVCTLSRCMHVLQKYEVFYVLLSLFLQWLPYNQWQVIYLMVRWILALYFLPWLIVRAVEFDHITYFLYLTDWAIIIWVLYLLIAASASTVKYIFHMYAIVVGKNDVNPTSENDPESDTEDSSPESIYLNWREDNIAWYQKIHWVFFNIALPLEVGVTFLYWSLLHQPGFPISGTNVNHHLMPGVIAVIDIWAVGIVLNIYHVYMIIVLEVIYGIFTLIYWAAGGVDFVGNTYIYYYLDYTNNPGLAAGTLIGCFFFFPFLYLVLYGINLLRRWLGAKFHGHFFKT